MAYLFLSLPPLSLSLAWPAEESESERARAVFVMIAAAAASKAERQAAQEARLFCPRRLQERDPGTSKDIRPERPERGTSSLEIAPGVRAKRIRREAASGESVRAALLSVGAGLWRRPGRRCAGSSEEEALGLASGGLGRDPGLRSPVPRAELGLRGLGAALAHSLTPCCGRRLCRVVEDGSRSGCVSES